LGDTDLQTSTMRRLRPESGCCWLADRINTADSVTDTGGITAARSDLRHFSDRIKVLYVEEYMGPNTALGFVFILAFWKWEKVPFMLFCFFVAICTEIEVRPYWHGKDFRVRSEDFRRTCLRHT